jgi:hypothetical protein
MPSQLMVKLTLLSFGFQVSETKHQLLLQDKKGHSVFMHGQRNYEMAKRFWAVQGDGIITANKQRIVVVFFHPKIICF